MPSHTNPFDGVPSSPALARPLADAHTDRREREPHTPAVDPFRSTWESQVEVLRQDPRLLKRCLDAMLKVDPLTFVGGAPPFLWDVFPLAAMLKVGPYQLRAALELLTLWPAPVPFAGVSPGAGLIERAINYAARADMQAIYRAVRGERGFPDSRLAARWDTPLPWTVLRPCAALRGVHESDFAATADWSYQASAALRKHYTALDKALTEAREAVRTFATWAEGRQREVLTGDARIDERNLDRIPRGELQRMANEKRARELARYFRKGDRAWNPSLLELIAENLDHVLPLVREPLAYLDTLAGDRPALVVRDPSSATVYRAIAAQLVQKINAALPRHRYAKNGVFRQEVQARASAIMLAVYGVTMSPDSIRTATDKRLKSRD